MKLIYLGDVVGRAGRKAVINHIPALQKRFDPDFVILNGENSAHGFGITSKICKQFFDAGVSLITLGNHAWDQREIIDYIRAENRLLRPLNFPENTPGNGCGLYKTKTGKNIFVVQVMGNLFMEPLENPFHTVDKSLEKLTLGHNVDCIVVDIHAEATSEKMAMGQFLDGRVSLVVGSHSHVPTADTQILPNGTAYQTDAGMCGDYNSVIGMKIKPAVDRFLRKQSSQRLQPAEGEGTACGVFLRTDDQTGLAVEINAIRLGGRLIPT